MKIDLVYLWCSNADPEFADVMNLARENLLLPTKKNDPDHRTTDHNELRYSLRSVEKFAPWINHIYIVTYQQVPKWLNIHHPKITIVDHSEIIPAEYLPTFNSAVIEAFLHKIPGLSEHFLFSNDDMFFGCETSPDFFFENETPIHYIRPLQKYNNSYWNKLLKRGKDLAEWDANLSVAFPAPSPSHNIDPYTKSLYADTVNHFWLKYQEMLPNKFRRNNDLQRFLVSCWGHLTDRLIWKEIDTKEVAYIEKITDTIENNFVNYPPHLFCLNDANILTGTDSFNQAKLLQKLFPDKSEFETDEDIISDNQNYGLKPAFSQNNIPIVFTIDEKFLPFCGVCLTSLIQNISPEYNYDIIVLNCGGNLNLLNDLMQSQLPKNVSLCLLNVKPYLDTYKKAFMKMFPSSKVTKWAKLFIHEWLNQYSKVVYLDADLLIKCDIAELWNADLDGKAVAGVVDMAAHHLESPKKAQMKEWFHTDNIDDYINLGVMVMNLDALRQMHFTKKLLDLISQIPEKFWNLYDIFNAILHTNIKVLPMTYNYQNGLLRKSENMYSYFRDEYYLPFQKMAQDSTKIVHFTPIKPWHQIIEKEGLNWWTTAKETKFYEMVLLCEKLLLNMPSQGIQKGNESEK